ncbi:MAG: hypothetical protein KJ990_12585 [Proteobacteria bacterium]|nr:hypothetical protein [Pseudomonadota bacterium]MBU1648225.1 hypothetical protein [Pseudomonadota bacterium]
MHLFAPELYWSLTPEIRTEICNGCGLALAKFDFVPNHIYGLCISDACNIHDYMYHVGETLADKEEADRVFLNNMLRLIEAGTGWLKIFRRRRALKYYEAVTAFGGPAFWSGKNAASEFREVEAITN